MNALCSRSHGFVLRMATWTSLVRKNSSVGSDHTPACPSTRSQRHLPAADPPGDALRIRLVHCPGTLARRGDRGHCEKADRTVVRSRRSETSPHHENLEQIPRVSGIRSSSDPLTTPWVGSYIEPRERSLRNRSGKVSVGREQFSHVPVSGPDIDSSSPKRVLGSGTTKPEPQVEWNRDPG